MKTHLLKTICISLFALLFWGFLSPRVNAAEMFADNTLVVPENKKVDGSYIAAGNSITVEGEVTGDLICAARHVYIRGSVDGDVLCAAQSIVVDGKVGGNFRSAGQTIKLGGLIQKNVTAFAQNLDTKESASIGGELFFGSQDTTVNGVVGKGVYGMAENVSLDGTIGQDVKLYVSHLSVNSMAKVVGPVHYTSDKPATIDPDSQIEKGIQFTQVTQSKKSPSQSIPDTLSKIPNRKLSSLFIYLGLGILAVLFLGKRFDKVGELALESPLKSMGLGFLALLISPTLFIFLFITIIGIPVALLLVFVFMLVLFISRLITSYVIGKLILNRLAPDYAKNELFVIILGVIVTWAVFSIPFIGFLLVFVSEIWVIGGIILSFSKRNEVMIKPPESKKVRKPTVN